MPDPQEASPAKEQSSSREADSRESTQTTDASKFQLYDVPEYAPEKVTKREAANRYSANSMEIGVTRELNRIGTHPGEEATKAAAKYIAHMAVSSHYDPKALIQVHNYYLDSKGVVSTIFGGQTLDDMEAEGREYGADDAHVFEAMRQGIDHRMKGGEQFAVWSPPNPKDKFCGEGFCYIYAPPEIEVGKKKKMPFYTFKFPGSADQMEGFAKELLLQTGGRVANNGSVLTSAALFDKGSTPTFRDIFKALKSTLGHLPEHARFLEDMRKEMNDIDRLAEKQNKDFAKVEAAFVDFLNNFPGDFRNALTALSKQGFDLSQAVLSNTPAEVNWNYSPDLSGGYIPQNATLDTSDLTQSKLQDFSLSNSGDTSKNYRADATQPVHRLGAAPTLFADILSQAPLIASLKPEENQVVPAVFTNSLSTKPPPDIRSSGDNEPKPDYDISPDGGAATDNNHIDLRAAGYEETRERENSTPRDVTLNKMTPRTEPSLNDLATTVVHHVASNTLSAATTTSQVQPKVAIKNEPIKEYVRSIGVRAEPKRATSHTQIVEKTSSEAPSTVEFVSQELKSISALHTKNTSTPKGRIGAERKLEDPSSIKTIAVSEVKGARVARVLNNQKLNSERLSTSLRKVISSVPHIEKSIALDTTRSLVLEDGSSPDTDNTPGNSSRNDDQNKNLEPLHSPKLPSKIEQSPISQVAQTHARSPKTVLLRSDNLEDARVASITKSPVTSTNTKVEKIETTTKIEVINRSNSRVSKTAPIVKSSSFNRTNVQGVVHKKDKLDWKQAAPKNSTTRVMHDFTITKQPISWRNSKAPLPHPLANTSLATNDERKTPLPVLTTESRHRRAKRLLETSQLQAAKRIALRSARRNGTPLGSSTHKEVLSSTAAGDTKQSEVLSTTSAVTSVVKKRTHTQDIKAKKRVLRALLAAACEQQDITWQVFLKERRKMNSRFEIERSLFYLMRVLGLSLAQKSKIQRLLVEIDTNPTDTSAEQELIAYISTVMLARKCQHDHKE